MPYFLFFEPHGSPEVVMGPISQMRKLKPGDVSSHAQGSPGTTWPVRFLPRPPYPTASNTLPVLPQNLLHSMLGLRDNSFLPGL